MKYYSTNNRALKVTFKESLFKGMPSDKGLYMPSSFPNLSFLFKQNISIDFQEISYLIASKYIGDELSNNDIHEIVEDSINFKANNKYLYDNIYCLELFHGPTLAFKDFGARFMSRCMQKFVKYQNKPLNILVATSGDTGSAVANGFYDIEGINVVILFPKGKVSKIQEKQLTILDKNIYSLEVKGTFDDCQKRVKQAFLDDNLKNEIDISSANSINIARLIPQSFYYINSYMQLKNKELDTVFCVPSGNFGNITAGIFAKQMGLPISKLIAATNSNDVVPKYFTSHKYKPKNSIQTISNAMDVGNPSNMVRIMDIYKNLENLKRDMASWSFTDSDTKKCIIRVLETNNYLLDPHSAIGLLGIQRYLDKYNEISNSIFLGTAHPAKFADIIEPIINNEVKIPETLLEIINKEKKSIYLKNDYQEFYDFLITTFQ